MFYISGDIVTVAREFGNKIDKIPAGVFSLEQNPQTEEFYLLRQDPFTLPSEVYGDIDVRGDKIINTYMDREMKNTGILLSGNKGSGKTLLAKEISIKLCKLDIPTIIIGTCYTDSGFINFLKSITQRVMVLFDEFDKVYQREVDQESILTLLDGTGTYNKLYVMTTNKLNVSTYLRNRPSRIFYHYEYSKISKSTLVDYIDRNLVNKIHSPKFETLWNISESLSFDVIQCLVEELNRYKNCTFTEALNDLNIELLSQQENEYSLVHMTVDGNRLEHDDKVGTDISLMYFVRKRHILRSYVIFPSKYKHIAEHFNGTPYHDNSSDYDECGDEPKDCDGDDVNNNLNQTSELQEYQLRLSYKKGLTTIKPDSIVHVEKVNGILVEMQFNKVQNINEIDEIFGE